MNVLEARKILELPVDWEPELLKSQYKTLARKYHPDKTTGSPEKFIKLKEAYDYINNLEKINTDYFDFFKKFAAVKIPIVQRDFYVTPKEYYTGFTRIINGIVIKIPKCSIKWKNYNVIVKDYNFIKDQLYYKFDITLKESLTGFNKTFKDPFENIHQIDVTEIVKQNDGYFITFPEGKLLLLFNVIYPVKISDNALILLKKIPF
jgi:curved DNA-binding protein CbpA